MENVSTATQQLAAPAPGQLLLQRLKGFYQQFSAESLRDLDALYTADVEFRDPLHTLHGCLALRAYFRRLAGNLTLYRIRYTGELADANSAYLSWEMDYAHPRLNGGKPISLRGITLVRFTDRIYYHEDCYDLGALVYEHVPVLGAATRQLKRLMAR